MKAIDPKYHIENETIIKTTNGVPIPDDEPLILFRARDRLAIPLLRIYRELCEMDGCTQCQIDACSMRIHDFQAFRDSHPEAIKQPGSTMGK
jgi:hypothetical protein